MHVPELFESPNDERFKQHQRHFLRQTALMQFQLRSDHDHRTTRIIHALSEEILAEPPTLALEHIAQCFQRAISGASDGPTVTAIVEQSIYRFLQHSLFVSNNHVRSLQLKKILQTIISVNRP